MSAVIVYMFADPLVPNAEHRMDSVWAAELVLRRTGFVHVWGFSWARGDDVSDLVYCDRALIADRRMHKGRYVSLYKRGR